MSETWDSDSARRMEPLEPTKIWIALLYGGVTMSPEEVSRRLRRVAARVDRSESPDAGRVSHSLARVADALEGDGAADVAVVLQGPFSRYERSLLGDEFEEEVEEILLQGDDFITAAMEAAGADPSNPDDRADFEGASEHEVVFEVSFDYTSPEPSVGWTGGTEVESWEVVAVDGLALENEADRKAVGEALGDYVKYFEGDWAEAYERSRSEY